MTDEKLIEILQKIHDKCEKTRCSKCTFNGKEHECLIQFLLEKLSIEPPVGWDMENIQMILQGIGEQNETVG